MIVYTLLRSICAQNVKAGTMNKVNDKMKKGNQKKKVEYIDGYDHYDKRRTTIVIFRINEAEKAFLDDLISVLNVRSISSFLRRQAFKAYRELTPEQKRQMAEVAAWRLEEARGVKCEK